jgi:hypothetical protein
MYSLILWLHSIRRIRRLCRSWQPRENDVPLIKGVINETGNPVATVGVGESDEVGEIFYTKFKQNLDQYRHNKILDVGKYWKP